MQFSFLVVEIVMKTILTLFLLNAILYLSEEMVDKLVK